jgi:hypothetical protein
LEVRSKMSVGYGVPALVGGASERAKISEFILRARGHLGVAG